MQITWKCDECGGKGAGSKPQQRHYKAHRVEETDKIKSTLKVMGDCLQRNAEEYRQLTEGYTAIADKLLKEHN